MISSGFVNGKYILSHKNITNIIELIIRKNEVIIFVYFFMYRIVITKVLHFNANTLTKLREDLKKKTYTN